MKDLTEYCSEELTKILTEKFNYPTNKTYWVKFSTFDYKRLAKLYEIQTWLRDEHTYHILIRHPRGFTGNGMEFWKYTYEIIVKNPENNWEGTFDELPKYLNDGTLIEYVVTETNVPEGYISTVDGTTITNTLKYTWDIVKVSSSSDDITLNGAEFTLTNNENQ